MDTIVKQVCSKKKLTPDRWCEIAEFLRSENESSPSNTEWIQVFTCSSSTNFPVFVMMALMYSKDLDNDISSVVEMVRQSQQSSPTDSCRSKAGLALIINSMFRTDLLPRLKIRVMDGKDEKEDMAGRPMGIFPSLVLAVLAWMPGLKATATVDAIAFSSLPVTEPQYLRDIASVRIDYGQKAENARMVVDVSIGGKTHQLVLNSNASNEAWRNTWIPEGVSSLFSDSRFQQDWKELTKDVTIEEDTFILIDVEKMFRLQTALKPFETAELTMVSLLTHALHANETQGFDYLLGAHIATVFQTPEQLLLSIMLSRGLDFWKTTNTGQMMVKVLKTYNPPVLQYHIQDVMFWVAKELEAAYFESGPDLLECRGIINWLRTNIDTASNFIELAALEVMTCPRSYRNEPGGRFKPYLSNSAAAHQRRNHDDIVENEIGHRLDHERQPRRQHSDSSAHRSSQQRFEEETQKTLLLLSLEEEAQKSKQREKQYIERIEELEDWQWRSTWALALIGFVSGTTLAALAANGLVRHFRRLPAENRPLAIRVVTRSLQNISFFFRQKLVYLEEGRGLNYTLTEEGASVVQLALEADREWTRLEAEDDRFVDPISFQRFTLDPDRTPFFHWIQLPNETFVRSKSITMHNWERLRFKDPFTGQEVDPEQLIPDRGVVERITEFSRALQNLHVENMLDSTNGLVSNAPIFCFVGRVLFRWYVLKREKQIRQSLDIEKREYRVYVAPTREEEDAEEEVNIPPREEVRGVLLQRVPRSRMV
jgi:hypothetical protein